MELDTIVCGDCLDVMADMPDGCVDLIVADAPYYQVAKEKWDKQWNSKEEYLQWMHSWTIESKRLLRLGGALYVFGGIGSRNGFVFWNYVEQVSEYLTFWSYINWRHFRAKGYRIKDNWPDSREDIANFIKGKRPRYFQKQYMRQAGLSNASKRQFAKTGVGLACGNIWIDIPEVQLTDGRPNRTPEHPAQKPERLMERIICASSQEGEIVFDPFIGSGTTAVAALELERHFYGCDISPEYVELANKRIEKTRLEMAQMEMDLTNSTKRDIIISNPRPTPGRHR